MPRKKSTAKSPTHHAKSKHMGRDVSRTDRDLYQIDNEGFKTFNLSNRIVKNWRPIKKTVLDMVTRIMDSVQTDALSHGNLNNIQGCDKEIQELKKCILKQLKRAKVPTMKLAGDSADLNKMMIEYEEQKTKDSNRIHNLQKELEKYENQVDALEEEADKLDKPEETGRQLHPLLSRNYTPKLGLSKLPDHKSACHKT